MQVFGIEPPRYFSSFLQTKDSEKMVTPSIQQFSENIRLLTKSISSFKLNNYLIAEENLQPKLSQGDIVILKEEALAKHDPGLSGPYVVDFVRKYNTYDISHIFTGRKLMRGGRFLRHVKLSDEEKKKLRDKNLFIRNDTGHIVLDDSISEFATSVLEQEPKLIFSDPNKSNEIVPAPKKYNLRKK